jgi:glucoamylase
MPLAWAHAEYLQLVRSATDGRIFTVIDAVVDRYQHRTNRPNIEVWQFNRQVRSVSSKSILRIQAATPFRLRWTCNQWQESHDVDSTSIQTGHEYTDVPLTPGRVTSVQFTFFWKVAGHWEQRNFTVDTVNSND